MNLIQIISKENREIAYDILSFKNTSPQHKEVKEFIYYTNKNSPNRCIRKV
mgnify:CR=1 FL=1